MWVRNAMQRNGTVTLIMPDSSELLRRIQTRSKSDWAWVNCSWISAPSDPD